MYNCTTKVQYSCCWYAAAVIKVFGNVGEYCFWSHKLLIYWSFVCDDVLQMLLYVSETYLRYTHNFIDIFCVCDLVLDTVI